MPSRNNKTKIRPNQYEKTIKIAGRLMSHKGYKAASLEEIASKVGIHKSTIYHYFKNKETLLFEVMKLGIYEGIQNLKEIIDDDSLSPEDKLKHAITNHIKNILKFRDNFNVYHSETRFLPPKYRKISLQAREDYAILFKKIIVSIQKSDSNYFKDIDSQIINLAIMGMCNWILKWHKPSGKYTPDEIAEMFYKLLIQDVSK